MITDGDLAAEQAIIEQRVAMLTANLHAANGALALVLTLRKRIADRAPVPAAETAETPASE